MRIITATYSNGKVEEYLLYNKRHVNFGVGTEVFTLQLADATVLIHYSSGLDNNNIQINIPDIHIRTIDESSTWNPKVGEGCNFGFGSDTYPYTVRKVTAKTVWISADIYHVKPGENYYDGSPKACDFYPKNPPEEEWLKFTRRDDGRFRPIGSKIGCLGQGRIFQQDPSF
jgi:hypothetical protein